MKTWGLSAAVFAASMLLVLSGSAAWAQGETSAAELETLKRMMQEIISENQELKARINKLEEAVNQQDQATGQAVKAAGKEPTKEAAKEPDPDLKNLEERVKGLETEKAAGENAVRSIVRQALSTLGSKINESVSLGGTLEVLAGWREDFSGRSDGVLNLNTAELDLEIKANDWTTGSLVLQWVDGTDVLFPTTSGFETGVDRVSIDTASITIGDPQRFPPFLTAGQVILPFGISTGDPVANVLTITDPLTIEAFEMRNVAIGFGVGFPTPAPAPPTPPVTPPPVRPLVLKPLIGSLMRTAGYSPPPAQPPAPTPLTPSPDPPLFNAAVYLYNGDTFEGREKTGWSVGNHINATLGFRTKGHCGRPYDQLAAEGRWMEFFCPWSVELGVDYNTSVFASRFLKSEYQSYLGQIGYVPGMAAHVRAAFGPISLIGEWNGAVASARLVDDTGRPVRLEPGAWQVTLGYQFDWNPWVERIGLQGNYVAVGYSESYDLAGVTAAGARVGFVPKRRFLVSLGEWVFDTVRFAVEYSHTQDYERSKGGTGRSANGVVSTLTYAW